MPCTGSRKINGLLQRFAAPKSSGCCRHLQRETNFTLVQRLGVLKPHGISRNDEICPERRSYYPRHFKEQLEMRAVVRSAWSRCVCNLHLLMQAAAIQGAMLQRLTAIPLRVSHDLTLERKGLLVFLWYRHPKSCRERGGLAPNRWVFGTALY